MTISECRDLFIRYRSQGLNDNDAAALVDQARKDHRDDCPYQARLDWLQDLRADLASAGLPTGSVDAEIAHITAKLTPWPQAQAAQ